MKSPLKQYLHVCLALTLCVGCGGGDSGGSEVFEEGLPVVEVANLQKFYHIDLAEDGKAPGQLFEGGIGIWFYKGQPFTGWAVAKHANGRRERKEFLQTGLQHGLTKTWYENGQLKSESNWRQGTPDGLEVMWHENGKIYVLNYWDRGVVLIKKIWDSAGAPMKPDGWNEDGTPIGVSKK